MAAFCVETQPRPALAGAEREAWRNLVEERTGLYFSDGRIKVLEGALWCSMGGRFTSFGEYCRHMAHAPAQEWSGLVEQLANNETSFFRQEATFAVLAEHILPRLAAQRNHESAPIAVWSAGCSTGEEPYSVAMLVREARRLTGLDASIVGTDISGAALARAREGAYSARSLIRMPARYRLTYFTGINTASGVTYRLASEVRAMVDFKHGELGTPSTYPSGLFDIILCQNVLIYFRPERRLKVVEGLISRLAPNGYLIPGPGELAGMRLAQVQCQRIGDAQVFNRTLS